MKRLLSLLTTWSVMAVALVVLLITAGDTVQAHNFAPTATLSLASTAPGASSDVNSTFGDPAPGYNFGAVINFTPPQWGVAKDADITDGTKVGELRAEATLGLLNNPCKDKVFPAFELLDGTVNSANPVHPKPPGTPDRLAPLSSDANGNGVIDGAEQFPSFLGPPTASNPDALFPAEALAKLRARLFGATTIAGIKVILNFMIFEPGTKISETIDIDPALGYPSVTVLNDPTAPASNEDPITDFCSPLATATTLLGTAGGKAFRTNPAEGSYNFILFAASLFDADEDGIENNLDPCPFNRDDQYGPSQNIAWDPRTLPDGFAPDEIQNPGDKDGDGIPDSCDPFPDVPSLGTSGIGIGQTDEDGDRWANRVDNCPLVSNADQANADSDSIGDACDPNPNTNDGHFHTECIVNTIKIGAGGTAPAAPNLCTNKLVGIDLNGNGVFDSLEGPGGTADADGDGVPDSTDQCPGTAAGAKVDAVGCTPQQAVLDDDKDGVLNAADKCPGTAAGAKVDAKGCSTAQLAAVSGPTGSDAGGPDTGVGSLAPAVSSIPTWAAIASGLGVTGLLGSIGAFFARFTRRRR